MVNKELFHRYSFCARGIIFINPASTHGSSSLGDLPPDLFLEFRHG